MGVEKRVSKQPKITMLTDITHKITHILITTSIFLLVSCKHLHKTPVEMYHF